ncbi:hypothetical protein DSCW_00280 [Desulfosarcina widdelii]|uniref:Uncharacterized protein n=1 Tax=Desulfosarcina widdelii TaxID=947919 RepID=A0A5K7YZK1_9BACT|nr:hypothetical protein [Desulfosarcina widdelii]BBO72611.1 hypothetical protein DSCW_00280 [Desulfosarcina widdelii]
MFIEAHQRFRLVQQIIRTMGFIPDTMEDDETMIFVGDDWVVFLPDVNPSVVAIGFEEEIEPHHAAELSMRFSKTLEFMNIEVIVSSELGRDLTEAIRDYSPTIQ